MEVSFSKDKIIKSALSPYGCHCVGYPGKGNYITALIMGIGSFRKTFSRSGSKVLDSILAYDQAEIAEAYMGQINMSIVSSFCGPQGLIWGYDIAKEEGIQSPSFLSAEKLKELEKMGVEIKSGENLRKAAKILFGTKEERHFPFLPGSHVPCAGRFEFSEGPTFLYAAIAIGIPEDRSKIACLFMEDVGKLDEVSPSLKEKVLANTIESVLEVGKNQGIEYKKIIGDFISKKIESNEMGCGLVVMPYFLLAKKAFDEKLPEQTLGEWVEETRRYFSSNQCL